MAKGTFDGGARLFICDSGVTDLDVQVDLYSDWKEWVRTGSNSKFAPMFRTVGGDPTSDTQAIGRYYFLLNGWRIRPQEADHVLAVVGNMNVDGGGSPYVSTLGAYNVLIETEFSNQAVQVFTDTGGGGFLAGDRAKLDSVYAGTAPFMAGIFSHVIDIGVTFGAAMKKLYAVINGDVDFSKPAPGEGLEEFKDQSGAVETTHHITPTGRTVT